MKNKLAILGGKPVLKKAFPPHNYINKEEKKAVAAVMESRLLSDFVGRAGEYFLGGKMVKEFEKEICKKLKVKYAVSFNSATTALQAAVGALGIGPGDEVITTPFTMSATATAILLNNAVPVFADIDPEYYCIDPVSIEKNISPKTKAIMAVNLFGGSADYEKIFDVAKKHKLAVIEDNAQSIGAKFKNKFLGTVGDIGVLSFNVHKTLQCGEGGVLVTNNEKLAFRAQLIRNHGEVIIDDLQEKGVYEPVVGSNYRLCEINSAIGLEQLKKMEILNRSRVELAKMLAKKMKKFKWLEAAKVRPGTTHVFYVFPFKFFEEKIGISRELFAKAMKEEGFPLGVGYVKPLYLMPLYQKREIYPGSKFPFVSSEFKTDISYKKGICPVTERMHEEELLYTSICHHGRTEKDLDMFVRAIEKIEADIEGLKNYEKRS